ncbi:preprotein translocase subunit SecE [bacterium]|jgi:preprotein translocase subunit SecE|nr:preprotein translocase subunit SecE [bacterium]MBT5015142.1 preprotein translocase subunit SecE [bacterium]
MKNIGQYLKSVQTELSKVTWPAYNEFIGSTTIVLILIVLFTIYLGALDFSFQWFAEKIFSGQI